MQTTAYARSGTMQEQLPRLLKSKEIEELPDLGLHENNNTRIKTLPRGDHLSPTGA